MPDDAALAAAALFASMMLLGVVTLGLVVPAAAPGLAIGAAAGALVVAARLGRNTGADPALLGAVSAAPVMTLTLLLMPGLGAVGAIGLPLAAGVAAAAAVAAARARPAADAPPTCARCGYDLDGLPWLRGGARCPECAFPDAAPGRA